MSSQAISFKTPDERDCTEMIIPVSEQTYFNIKWKPKEKRLCAYDMLFHPPDYDPQSARSDRTDPKKIRQNIWEQEKPKPIPSTNHLMYGRPYWQQRLKDNTSKLSVRSVAKNQNPHMRIYDVLKWAELLYEGKEQCLD